MAALIIRLNSMREFIQCVKKDSEAFQVVEMKEKAASCRQQGDHRRWEKVLRRCGYFGFMQQGGVNKKLPFSLRSTFFLASDS